MNNKPIAFFDSGVGGLPYLDWIKRKFKRENYIYLADTKHAPYGERSKESIHRVVLGSVGRLIAKKDPKLVVIACNTASVVALKALREKYDLPFIGVVPAVKPAAEVYKSRRIGILATNQTTQNSYLDGLITNFASHAEVLRVSGGEIVRFVEHDFINASERERQQFTKGIVAGLKGVHLDSLVLGCTHFIFLKKYLENALDHLVPVVDSVEGVGKQVMRVLEEKSLWGNSNGHSEFYISGSGLQENYKKFARRFNLDFKGIL